VNAARTAGEPSLGWSEEPRRVRRYGTGRRLFVSGLIAFHIVATVLWLLPAASALRRDVHVVTDKYIAGVGLWQAWGMFAPEPSDLNIYIHARITYADGSEREWSFPRMNQLDLFTRYREERYRKYEEYAHLDSYGLVWPDLARWVARRNNPDPHNPPVRVRLIRSWWVVPPPPASGDISHDPPHEWSHFEFFSQRIAAADL